MRTENIALMIAIGLALGEEANRRFGNSFYRMRLSRRNSRGGGSARAADEDTLRDRSDNYLEQLATQYEIIPLMSKLI